MTSNNFDYDIDNYSKSELEEILGLPPNYNKNTIDTKVAQLRDTLYQDSSIGSTTREKTMAFLDEVSRKLNLDLNVVKVQKIADSDIYNLNANLKTSKTTDDNNSSHNSIQKEVKPFVLSYPDTYFNGVMNPLKKRVLTKNLNIDTRFRDNYYSTQSSNFHLDLPIKFVGVLSMELVSFQPPFSLYAISGKLGNNFFTLMASNNDGTGVESAIITVPDGNYFPQDLNTYLNNHVKSAVFSVEYPLLSKVCFSIDLSGLLGTNGSGRMIVGILSPNDPTSFSFSLNFQNDIHGNPDYSTPLPLKLGWMLGFRQGIYTNNPTYISESIVDISGPKYIYIAIDDYNNNVNNGFYSAFNSSILNKNIIGRIQLPYFSFFNTSFQNSISLNASKREYFGPVTIQKMQVQLLDEYGRVLDMNNTDYSFLLTFDISYEL
jgi:hypothetical protein